MPSTIAQNGTPLIPGKVYRVVMYTWIDGQLGLFGADYLCSASVPAGTVTTADLAKEWYDAVEPLLEPCQPIQVSILGAKCFERGTTPMPLPGIATSAGDIGTNVGDPMPTQVSGIIRFQTAMTGRKYRGRAYIPFPSLTSIDTDQTPTAAYLTLLQSLGNAILAFITVPGALLGSATVAQCIYHKATNNSTLVTGNSRPKLYATQRKRGDYGRTNGAIVS